MLSSFQAKRTRVTPGLASILKGTRGEESTQQELSEFAETTAESNPAKLQPVITAPIETRTQSALPTKTPSYRPVRKPRSEERLELNGKKNASVRSPRLFQQQFPETTRKPEVAPKKPNRDIPASAPGPRSVPASKEPGFQRPVQTGAHRKAEPML
ncbi:MAG: hypothetical protein CMO80_09850 [Verrucomicrobiales bacterium]|nr:hypothetical protein [Verrucomicrobiales bacterium]